MPISVLINRSEIEQYATMYFPGMEYTITEYADRRDTVHFTTAIGRTISLREMNGYDDSDFYATFLDGFGCIAEYQYASTRGWSYANYAERDATPEVMEKVRVIRRRQDITRRWAARKSYRQKRDEKLAKANLTMLELKKLERALSSRQSVEAIVKLLGQRLRSPFKKSMAKQIRDWLADPNPQFRTPLSAKQMQWV